MSTNTASGYDLKVAADYQQLVDDIESLMASPAGVDSATVSRLFARYEQAVKAINVRLRECDALLKKGLRNEALERCEIEPKLLDIFLIVDFPERDSWEDTVRQCGLSVPDLLVSVAAELNDAYSTEKPLAELKYQVRLHALARSPLPIRISLMRRLAKQDQNSTVWDEDLKIFERARHNQLAGDVQSAIKTGNMVALADLQRELQSPEWTTAPSPGLLKQVSDSLTSLQRKQAREELWTVEPMLTAAFAAFDVQRGREVRDTWQKLAGIAALPSSDPLMQTVAPALQWLEEQDQQEREERSYRNLLGTLVQVLNEGAGRSVLEERYHVVMALGRGIPEDVQERLEQRLKQLDREKARSLQLKLAGAGLAIALLAGFAYLMISSASFYRQLKAQVATLEKMLEDKELDAAEQHLTKLDAELPSIAATDEIQKVRTDLKTAQAQDADRKVEFKNLLAAARRDGVDQATFKSLPVALVALDKAWNLAVYNSEKIEVKDLSQLIESKKANLAQLSTERIGSSFGKMSDDFARFKKAPLDHLSELEAMKSEITAVLQNEEATEKTRTTYRPFAAEVDQAVAKGRSLQNEARILVQMKNTIGDRIKYFEQIDRYVNSTEFAGTTRCNDFARVLKIDGPLAIAFHEWHAFLEDLMRRDLTSLSANVASKIRTDAEKLIKDYPGFPFIPQVQEIVTYLGKSAARERGSVSMEQLLALKTFKVYSVRADGKQYYMPTEPPEKEVTRSTSIRYFTDAEFKNTKQIRLPFLEHEPKWRSPQAVFENEASELLGKLRDKKGSNWDQTFIELLEKLYNNQEMDEILKVQLISHTIRSSAEGSNFLPKRLERVKSEIERENLNNAANWVSPDDTEAHQVRVRAQTLLKRIAGDLRDMKEVMAEAQQITETFKKPRFDIRYDWTGWMHRDQSGDNWTCTFRKSGPINPQGELFALVKSDAGQVSFVRIGRTDQGQPKLEDDARDLLEGRPVFEKKGDLGTKTVSK